MNRITIFFLTIIAPMMAIALAILGVMTIRTNLLGWFLLFIGILYPVGLVVVYFIRRKKYWITPPAGKTIRGETGDRSFWFVSVGIFATFYLPPLEYLYFGFVSMHIQWVQILGLELLIIGVALFAWARRTLGASYSGHISTVEGQKLVLNGPYKLIRHPAYAAYLLISIGISVGYSSLAGIIAVVFLLIPGLIYRMRIEEMILMSTFGDQYKQYQSRTTRLIPWVW